MRYDRQAQATRDAMLHERFRAGMTLAEAAADLGEDYDTLWSYVERRPEFDYRPRGKRVSADAAVARQRELKVRRRAAVKEARICQATDRAVKVANFLARDPVPKGHVGRALARHDVALTRWLCDRTPPGGDLATTLASIALDAYYDELGLDNPLIEETYT